MEARRLRDEFVAEVRSGRTRESSRERRNATFAAVADHWLRTQSALVDVGQLAPRTLDDYELSVGARERRSQVVQRRRPAGRRRPRLGRARNPDRRTRGRHPRGQRRLARRELHRRTGAQHARHRRRPRVVGRDRRGARPHVPRRHNDPTSPSNDRRAAGQRGELVTRSGSAIAVTGLHKSFGDHLVLAGVDLEVAEGTILRGHRRPRRAAQALHRPPVCAPALRGARSRPLGHRAAAGDRRVRDRRPRPRDRVAAGADGQCLLGRPRPRGRAPGRGPPAGGRRRPGRPRRPLGDFARLPPRRPGLRHHRARDRARDRARAVGSLRDAARRRSVGRAAAGRATERGRAQERDGADRRGGGRRPRARP